MSGIKWEPPVNWEDTGDERAADKYLRERDEREAKK